ncbi:Sulfate starvation-induced protein 1 [Kluyvera cryocrescens]|uniref:Sulfate starvation-induced protein 1 n=1 Tax=Kluyvera cryocrescens TaxID=580 RepID=A0A485D2R3_KLUCR|nr:Sulfate starvation-induced protein 1 [Kluyvera cryocrescens]
MRSAVISITRINGWPSRENISKLSRLSGVPESDVPGLVKGNTYLTAEQQAQALNGPVNKAIVDTAQFLKEQGKVPNVRRTTASTLPTVS